MISFFVAGTPVAQSRPRFARRGNFVATYDAAPAKDYKSWVKYCALDEMGKTGLTIINRDVPLKIDVVINLQRPKSKPKRFVLPTTKPDCDNILKGLQDALEGIVYEADQQIVSASVQKQYHVAAGVHVHISEFKIYID